MPETFALQLTPPATGAIAVVLLTGPNAAQILQQLTTAGPNPSPISSLFIGQSKRIMLYSQEQSKIENQKSKIPLDDALLLRTAPNRYELHLHGGIAVVTSILEALAAAGAKILTLDQAATQGLLGTTLEAELQLALPAATTPTALRLLLNQPTALTTWTNHWLTQIKNQKSKIENPPSLPHLVTLSPCHDLHTAARQLLTRSLTLAHLLTPPRIAIIGPPNAGKSTLANALLGRPASITSDIPGTTRDWVDARAILSAPSKNFPEPLQLAITLVDTAGIRPTSDPLESESIRRTHHQAAAADAILFLFDATRPPTPEELALPTQYQSTPHLIVLNKTDTKPNPLFSFSPFPLFTAISAKTHQNLDTLMTALLQKLNLHDISPTEPFAFTSRQRQLLHDFAASSDADTCARILSAF